MDVDPIGIPRICNKKVIFKAYSFSNTSDGAAGLMEKIQPFQSELEIGMEATGHYWLSLYSFLAEQRFVIHVINPIQTDGWRKGTEIRKRKTDIIDSVLIAYFIRYGEFLETSLADEDTMSLRNLTRFRNYLVSSIGDLKRKAINSPITTIPGIGDAIAATILGEIGDINRFSSGAKLVAYAGIDAEISQSGEYEATSNKMSKRGSPFLRKALFQAAFIASYNDPIFTTYYQQKRAVGKHHKVAVGAVARKLCHTIHAVLKKILHMKSGSSI
ncbi:MAG TPA: hypothetical protein DHV55_15675 [Clostridiaceae bacterium]|nr:hypothetical protein [Clostridiaceae bacterium]